MKKRKKISGGKKLGWWFSIQALRIFFILVRALPRCFLPKLANGLGVLVFYLAPRIRSTGVENARKVFGPKIPNHEARALIKGNLKDICRNMLEAGLYYFYPQPQRILGEKMSIQGQEHLDNALKKGKGVIAVSAHLGSFPLIGAKMAAMGYSFWLIYKDPENIYLKDIFRQWLQHLGIGIVPYKPRWLCASKSLKVLRDNGILLVFVDQNPRRKYGVYVEFFGYQVPTYSGPVVMASKTGASILPVFIHRNDDATETITIQSEISLKKSNDYSQDVIDNLREIKTIYENWIRKYPEQWWWIHRRFRRAR